MSVSVHNLIAAINPIYCDDSVVNEVKRLVKEKGYLAAAEKVKLKESEFIDLHSAKFSNPWAQVGQKNPIERHVLEYDYAGNLEPIYYWIIDYLNKEYGKTEKLVDNFLSSVGSGHFSEMQSKATKMQEEAMKMLGAAKQDIKSIFNLVYDLKEFKIRLSVYDELRSKDPSIRNSAMLSLKQIWLDTVDIKRGNTAVKAMAQQFDYVTIIDAFMAADSLESVTKKPEDGGLDLNERVRRIIQQRIGEFFRWIEISEKELTKRFEIEKLYLKSQVNTVKLYSRWIKPYLKAARQLEQRANPTSSLVSSFNTLLMELSVMAFTGNPYAVFKDVMDKELPEIFKELLAEKKVRDYHSVAVVEVKFRSIPERLGGQGGYAFRGRVEINMASYSLNKDELELLRKEIEKDDFGDLFGVLEGVTEESLAQIQADIDELLEDKPQKNEEDKSESEDTNPFFALFSFLRRDKSKADEKGEKDKNGKKITGIKPDNDYEIAIRSRSIIDARKKLRKLYGKIKGAYNIPDFPYEAAP